MKKLYKFVFVSVLSVLILAACQDELVKAPLDTPSNTNFFSNESELELAINGVYRSLWWESGFPNGMVHTLQEIDNSTDIGFLRAGTLKELSQGAHTSETGEFESTWAHLFGGIAKANNLLQNMDRAQDVVTPDLFTRIQAEARFLRAFFYHFLIELYGDVPLLTEVPTIEGAQIGRAPKSDVVDQIIEDLNFAAQNLPGSWSGDAEGRATKGAALALKARVALYTERYEIAAQTAQEVMDLGIYELYPNYEAQFQYEGIRSSGVIFDVPYGIGVHTIQYPWRAGSRMNGAVSTHVPSQAMVDSYQASDGEPIDESSIYNPENPFEKRDPRLDASIVRPQSIFKDFVFETHPDSTETWRIEDGQKIARVTNQDVTNPFATFTGYLWRKYLSPEDFPDNSRQSTLNFIYIRYAEVLLIYAEAKIESNDIDQSVLDAMNQVRARGYGVDPSQTNQYPEITAINQVDLRREIRYERKVELASEGFRLFDIRRWGIADEVMDGILIGRPIGAYSTIPGPPNINEDMGHPDYGEMQDLYRNVESRSFNPERDWLWAIPQAEINVNDQMTQNAGY